TGFFGRWLLESFARANDRHSLEARATVVALDAAELFQRAPHLATDRTSDRRIDVVETDLTRERLSTGGYTHVIHAASFTAVRPGENPRIMANAIVDGARNVLR